MSNSRMTEHELERDRDQQRNLIYTGITRGKWLLALVGPRKALGGRFPQRPPARRYSGLLASLRGEERAVVG